MIDFFEKTKGSISLFLALIMLPMMTVAGLIVDGARISAAKASLSGAGDLAMNAALSEYDQILYDVYGCVRYTGTPSTRRPSSSFTVFWSSVSGSVMAGRIRS